jgi:hypothetical protein
MQDVRLSSLLVLECVAVRPINRERFTRQTKVVAAIQQKGFSARHINRPQLAETFRLSKSFALK